MKNNLVSKLKNGIYTGLVGILALGSACSDGPTQPKTYNLPVNNFYVSPMSGVSPLPVTVQGGCIADAGVQSYKTMLDGNVISTSYPIDTTITLSKNSALNSECVDKVGNVVSSGMRNVQVMQPSFSDKATLSDSVNIVYNATMNVPKAERKMFGNNGNLIRTDTITGPTYTDTIPNVSEGNYYFTNNINSGTAKVTEPPYPITIDTTDLQTDTTEGGVIGSNLASRMHKKNPGSNPIHLTNAVPLDTITSVQRNGDSVTTTALGNRTGPYNTQLSMIAANGDTGSYILRGNFHDVPDISGNLQNSETDSATQGIIRPYTIETISGKVDTIPLLTNISNTSGNILTDSIGKFSFRINKRSSDLTNILLRAKLGASANDSNYVRSIILQPKDTSGLLVSAVPKPIFTTSDSFATFMQQIDYPLTRFDFNGEYIPGFKGLQGIEILPNHPNHQSWSFTPAQDTLMYNKILDPNDINGIIGRNKIMPNQVILGDSGHYTMQGDSVIPDSGWIIVVPDSNIISDNYSGLTVNSYSNPGGTLVYKGVISIVPWEADNGRVISHEFGHMFIAETHPTILPVYTVMNLSSRLQTTGLADKKAGKLIYEPTFMTFPPSEYPTLDYLKNILGLNFK